MIDRECPVCGSNRSSLCCRKANFDIVACRVCRHMWAHQVPDLRNLDTLNFQHQYCNYNIDIANVEYSKLTAGETPGSHVHTTNLLLRRMLEELRWRGRSHLDVGCGSGYLLSQSKLAMLEVQGIDPGPWAQEAARRRQIPVESSFLRNHHYGRVFDLVTATDVIEHQASPIDFLDLLASNVSRTGFVVLSFPCSDSFNAKVLGARWSMIAPPTHCQFFSHRSVATLAERCHLTIVAKKQYNSGGFPILSRSHLFNRIYSRFLDGVGWGDQMLIALALSSD